MAVNVESGKTFKDLQLALAIKVGQASYGTTGDKNAQLPDDVATVDQLKRKVNEGYRRFLLADQKWTFLQSWETFKLEPGNSKGLNPGDDTGRYRLPMYIHGNPESNWIYLDEDAEFSHGTTVSAEKIMPFFQQYSTKSCPKFFACRRIPDGDQRSGVRNQWEVLAYPRPDRQYRVTALFRIQPYEMELDDEFHAGGAIHDRTVFYAAAAEWYEDDRHNPKEADRFERKYQESLAHSKKLDQNNKAKRRGLMVDPGLGKRSYDSRRPYGLVLRVSDHTIPGP